MSSSTATSAKNSHLRFDSEGRILPHRRVTAEDPETEDEDYDDYEASEDCEDDSAYEESSEEDEGAEEEEEQEEGEGLGLGLEEHEVEVTEDSNPEDSNATTKEHDEAEVPEGQEEGTAPEKESSLRRRKAAFGSSFSRVSVSVEGPHITQPYPAVPLSSVASLAFGIASLVISCSCFVVLLQMK